MKKITILLLLVAMCHVIMAQGKISGRVMDRKSNDAIEYATVTLHKISDTSLVTGAATASNGSFVVEKIPYGKYLLKVSYMGYKPYFYPEYVALSASAPSLNLGKLMIEPSATTLKEAEVVAERSMVEYQLDKRVINVDKNIVSGGGTASDVLEQVPSVSIDNDGNVSLRGSSNVKVLINGRPSELLGSDIATLLEQIPASTVENVEVITNPSAKYDPEGMSGIINIKLKDKSSGALGLNGLVNVNIGSPIQEWVPTAMSTINLNYTTKKYAITFAADGGQRARGMNGITDIARKNEFGTYSHDSLYEHRVFPNRMASAKLGFEYHFDDKNSLLVSYQLRGGNRVKYGDLRSVDLLGIGMDYVQTDTSSSKSLNHVVGLNYTKLFDKADESLTLDVTLNLRKMSGKGYQEQLYAFADSNYSHYYYRLSEQDNHHENINIRLNYTYPFVNGWKLETGYEGRMSFPNQDSRYNVTRYNSLKTLETQFDSSSSTHYDSQQQIHAIYATLGGKITEKLSAQAGLRGEYSFVEGYDINHPEVDKVYKAYPQLYPTLHASYQMNKVHSMQLSYSRRVRRPHMWDLNPYLDVREGQQMSFGNPYLAPEFTNALEFSYNMALEKTNIYACLYYRQTDSMMTRYGFVWNEASADYYAYWIPYSSQYDGYWASTLQNLNKGQNYGLELILDYQICKWWKVNVSVNLYESVIEGTDLLHNKDKKNFQCSGKFNTYMNLPKDWVIQVSGQYWAPWLDLQTEMFSNKWVDIAVKKDVLKKQGTINFRVGDALHTAGFGHYTNDPQMERRVTGRRLGPVFTLGFSYKINNGLKTTKPVEQQDSGEDGGEY